MSQTKQFILVDGSSYLFRAYHALPPLTTSKGEPVGAIIGVINMLKRLLVDYSPDYLAIIFDTKGPTFRHEMYKEYKANRAVMPDELAVQIKPLHDIIKAMGMPLMAVPGVEADDVIGTLARSASSDGVDVVISTGDKDMAQLVNSNITLINTMSNTSMDCQGVIDKFGVPPEKIIDYLALVGDSVDNVPGIPKVGPKTAVKLLSEYDTMNGVIDNSGSVKGKLGENIRSAIKDLPLYRDLVTIKDDVELDLDWHELVQSEPDKAWLSELFTWVESKRWLAELRAGELFGKTDQQLERGREIKSSPVKNQLLGNERVESSVAVKTSSQQRECSSSGELELNGGEMQLNTDNITQLSEKSVVKDGYSLVNTQEELNKWLAKINQSDYFAFDLETTSLDYMQAEIVGIAIAVKLGEAAYIPLAHTGKDVPEQLNRDQVLAKFRPMLEGEEVAKLGQNLKYDSEVLANVGIKLKNVLYDTMLESYIYNSVGSRHDMDSLALNYLGEKTTHYEDVAGKGAKQVCFSEVNIVVATNYAAEDADITLRLHDYLWPKLQSEPGLLKVYQEIELPLMPILVKIEREGVLLDVDMLSDLSHGFGSRLEELQAEVFNMAGEEFNLNSTKQLQGILFDKLELPVLKKTPKGQPSTAEGVLQELARDFPLPKVIMEYRSLAKLKNTYTDTLAGQVSDKTGRLHTSYHQAITATGRLSSSSPNLQNIPIRSEDGRKIRKAFVAPRGYKILAADYSQIELRIMAHLSQDNGLLSAFRSGKDVHSATAAEVFGCAIEDVDSEHRRRAKAINFGLIYGMSAFGLAKQLGIGRKAAQEYMDIYFERYPGVLEYMDRTRKQAKSQGFVETLFGRRLYLPEINSKNFPRQAGAERAAINAPLQGTAADIIKLAMIGMDKQLTCGDIDAKMIMQVHDELVFEVNENDIDRLKVMIKKAMEGAAELDIPLIVDIGIGENWDEAH